MKRSLIAIICMCSLVFCLGSLAACGNSNSGSGSTSGLSSQTNASTASSDSSSTSIDASSVEAGNVSSDDVRKIFEQTLSSMSEFYSGSSPANEYLYYAGGAVNDNGIFAIIEPDPSQSAVFVGPVSVEDGSNKLTVTDESLGAAVAIYITQGEDGAILFSFTEGGSTITMNKCTSTDIVNALVQIVQSQGGVNDAPSGDQATENPDGNGSAEDAAAVGVETLAEDVSVEGPDGTEENAEVVISEPTNEAAQQD